jgi:hypothetical protein
MCGALGYICIESEVVRIKPAQSLGGDVNLGGDSKADVKKCDKVTLPLVAQNIIQIKRKIRCG